MADDSEPNLLTDELTVKNVLKEVLEERDIDVDYPALDAVSNIYRAAAAVRRRAEVNVLKESGLSWGGFTILWVLWIWGEMEASHLATECDLAKGTLTGMLDTLERQDLVTRTRLASDRRRIAVALSEVGRDTIAELYPRFNRFESDMTAALSAQEQATLSSLLRRVITQANR